jgi:uncharacterized membrane protein
VTALLIISLSAVVFLGALVFVLCRWAGLRTWHAVVCLLFGFTLASSPAAPTINQALRALVDLL